MWNMQWYFHIWNIENSIFTCEICTYIFYMKYRKLNFHTEIHTHIFLCEIQKFLFSYMKYTPIYSYIKYRKFFHIWNMHLYVHIWNTENSTFIYEISTYMFIHKIQKYRPGFDLWVGKISWRRGWLPTPVFLPGELHGQRSLADYTCSLWGELWPT